MSFETCMLWLLPRAVDAARSIFSGSGAGSLLNNWSGGLAGNLMPDQPIIFGHRNVWGGTQPYGLLPADRRHHTYIIGATGTGKSTLLCNLILQDIEAGRGVG